MRNVRTSRWRSKFHGRVESRQEGWKEEKAARLQHEEAFDLEKKGVHALSEEERLSLKFSILKYWFLLDYELKEAITKDNLKLARVAIQRIKFLSPYVKPDLMKGAIEGDEQSLEMLTDFLIQKGLSEKADRLNISEVLEPISPKKIAAEKRDLILFIWDHKELVHPNVLKNVRQDDEESINLALRHIHYGSLQKAREIKKKEAESSKIEADEVKKGYKEALLRPTFNKPLRFVDKGGEKKSKGLAPNKTVFVYNIPAEAKVQEIWKGLKAWGKVPDISLLIKKDKFGRRFGFARLASLNEAEKFISSANGKFFQGNQLKVQYAKDFKKDKAGSSPPSRVESNGGSVESYPDAGFNLASPTKFLEFEARKDLEEEIGRSMVIELWKPSSVTEVVDTLEMLGFVNIVVRGISSFKFLLTWDSVEKLEETDIELLSLGFLSCKKASWRDIIPNRRAIIECTGMPWVCWNLSNLSKILQEWGRICAISNPTNMDMTFHNPVVIIDTARPRDLFKSSYIRFQGETLKVHSKEIYGVEFEDAYDQYLCADLEENSDRNVEGKSCYENPSEGEAEVINQEVNEEDNSLSDILAEPGLNNEKSIKEGNFEKSYQIDFNSPSLFKNSFGAEALEDGKNLEKRKEPRNSSAESSVLKTNLKEDHIGDSLVNSANKSDRLSPQNVERLEDEKWKARDKTISSNFSGNTSFSLKGSKLEDSIKNGEVVSVSSVVNHVNKLHLGKKRGRPVKKTGKKVIKSFDIKIKSKSDDRFSSILPSLEEESAKVLESCLLMGLGLEMCNSDALVCIKDRLK
uniref:RRM domain-containing protein n=1 Tax=Daucus carota subsp. sativus TaxID=79200 RepID=A0A166EQM6_DAUCS